MAKKRKIFFYNKKINKLVKAAVEQVLGVRVKKVLKMRHGEVNHVYKVISDRADYLARVFKHLNWPEDGKLIWIESQLAKQKIPRARILYYSRGKKFFPHGFMVTEFIEGYNGVLACDRGQLTRAEAYKKIGRTLKKVHKIKVNKFGSIKSGKGEYSDFLQWILKKEVGDRFKQLKPAKAFSQNFEKSVADRLKNCLSPFAHRFRPVLNHGDPNRENAIWSTNKQWVLVDWDNAIASTWLEDFSDVSFWMYYKRTPAVAEKRHKAFVKNFFAGYGQTEFSQEEIKRIEYALHIIKCLWLLTYYRFYMQDKENFAATKRRLYELMRQDF